MKRERITSLEGIKNEQERLKVMMKVTRQEFTRSLDDSQGLVKTFVMDKLEGPVKAIGAAGAVGLGAAAIGAMTNKSDRRAKHGGMSKLWTGLIPLAFNIVQTYFLKKNNDEIEEIEEETPEIEMPPAYSPAYETTI